MIKTLVEIISELDNDLLQRAKQIYLYQFTDKAKMKNCPFCGGPLQIQRLGPSLHAWKCECSDEELQILMEAYTNEFYEGTFMDNKTLVLEKNDSIKKNAPHAQCENNHEKI